MRTLISLLFAVGLALIVGCSGLDVRLDGEGDIRPRPPTFTPGPAPTHLPTFTPYPTETTEAVERLTGVALSNANVRSGPGLDYPVLSSLEKGKLVQVVGNDPERTWLRLSAPSYGWVYAGLIELDGDRLNLPINTPAMPPPATATMTLSTKTKAPTLRRVDQTTLPYPTTAH